jgi:hypothetical protein
MHDDGCSDDDAAAMMLIVTAYILACYFTLIRLEQMSAYGLPAMMRVSCLRFCLHA